MAIGISLTPGESGAMALGQMGAIFENGVSSITGKQIVAIQIVDEVTWTRLTPETSDFIGTASSSGDSVVTTIFPAGLTIYGQWTEFQLAKGAVIAYLGKF